MRAYTGVVYTNQMGTECNFSKKVQIISKKIHGFRARILVYLR
jgi:hypothetical protein